MDFQPFEPVIIGADVSATRVAFVALFEKKFHTMSNTKLGKSGAEACHNGREAVNTFLGELPWSTTEPIEVFIEAPVLGRGGFRSTMVQAFTNGAVQGAFYERGCKVSSANVSSWKKEIVGKGNATKPDVAQSIRLRWASLYENVAGDQDLCDASAIALYGRTIYRLNVE
jgi:Holliday junction resolvasome RuvABC endonuclease subunit